MSYDDYDHDEWEMLVDRFADPGGNSALHPATADNPRNLPCPTCGWPNRLTARDVAHGYCCDSCADAQEQGRDIHYYEGEEVMTNDPIPPFVPISEGSTCANCGAPATKWMDNTSGYIETLCAEWPDCEPSTKGI